MTRRRRRIALFVTVALGALAMPAHARVPNWTDSRPISEQSQLFRSILHELGITPLNSWVPLYEDPSNKFLIVLGGTDQLDLTQREDELQRFLSAGGSALIATDQATSAYLNQQLGGAAVEGKFVRALPPDCYRQMTECPLMRLHWRQSSGHSLFRDLRNTWIATNRPSRITTWRWPLEPVATIPHPGPFKDFSSAAPWKSYDESVLAVAAVLKGGGRLLVIADHSIFINGMLQQSDNDNIAFAVEVVRWLSEDGKRTEALCVDDAIIQRSFRSSDVQPLPPALPPLEAMMPRINQFIQAIERENVINKAILQAVPHASILRGAALALTMGLLSFGILRFLNARHRSDVKPLSVRRTGGVSPRVALSATSPSSAARELARATFDDLGRPAMLGAAPPAIAVRGRWRARRVWCRRIDRLWAIAVGDEPFAGDLRTLHAELLAVRSAVADGVVHFPTDP